MTLFSSRILSSANATLVAPKTLTVSDAELDSKPKGNMFHTGHFLLDQAYPRLAVVRKFESVLVTPSHMFFLDFEQFFQDLRFAYIRVGA
jgi:hypothetical protein